MSSNKDIKIGLVIMASGLGKRFGSQKLMELLGEKPLLQWILETSEGLFDRRIVVTRDHYVEAFCKSFGLDCIYHEYPHRNDTVRLGLSAMKEEMDVCFFTPGDQPFLKRDTLEKLVEEAKSKNGTEGKENHQIIRPYYGELDGAPIGFPSLYFEELLSLPESKGGGYVAGKYSEAVTRIPVQEEWELWDVDTREDLIKLSGILQKNNI